MTYRITIVKRVANPEYAEKLADYERRQGYYNGSVVRPEQFIDTDSLSCEVTEDQFATIRKAALEVF